ncbi:MAG: nucleotide sugar dehydrogenase [Defluviitaleaceae bacterium]|nr:nucleotide sugar dehydrogenase [Defluviitaleaceae bacterium]
MSLYEKLRSGEEALSVIGLGYVGLPLAVAFANHVKTIGFDVSKAKIAAYKNGTDPTGELTDQVMQNAKVDYTFDAERLKEAKFHIIAVPTPLDLDNDPDLSYVVGACRTLGKHLTKGSIVVSESTVYPGVTEDICVPILEKESGLTCGVDFKVGYSPERINPGDKVNTLETIVKIVSGMDADSLDDIAKTYEIVVKAGVYRVSSIKVAESVKVVENTQRDVNIAFMNEIAMLLDKLSIDMCEVVDAMNTKWNALKFHPGLVGGHCISVDPHYLMYEVQRIGHDSRIVTESRKLNDAMSEFIGEAVIKQLALAGKVIPQAKVAILGLAFKENTADIRNSKVVDIIKYLAQYGMAPLVVDPLASPQEAMHEYGITLTPLEDLRDLDCVIHAVSHDAFNRISFDTLDNMYGNYPNHEKVLIDVKCSFCKAEAKAQGYRYWHL